MINFKGISERKNENGYSTLQLTVLVILRLVVGYHFLYEGFDKLLNPNWTSAGFLSQANWMFSGFFQSLANNQTVLFIVDSLNIWAQVIIGLLLILGLFSRGAAVFGALMILLYYIAIPPFAQNYIFIDKNLLEFFALLVIALFQTSDIIGLDRLIKKFRSFNLVPRK
ncbi:MAG: DoxX family membrane protein [Ignavibacteria bacterium]|jgi:thiosulfate dehydrogenase [quinone] large subunit